VYKHPLLSPCLASHTTEDELMFQEPCSRHTPSNVLTDDDSVEFVVQCEEEDAYYVIDQGNKIIFINWTPGHTHKPVKLLFLCNKACCE